MTRIAVTLLAALALACAIGQRPLPLAPPPARAPELPPGRPTFGPGAPQHYWIWGDGDGWHLRVTSPGELHRFQGTVVPLGGGFSDLRALSAESSDHVRVTARGIEFDLTLDRGVDGFDWEADSGCNRFELLVDGASRPDRVRLGGTATPAETMPFERCR